MPFYSFVRPSFARPNFNKIYDFNQAKYIDKQKKILKSRNYFSKITQAYEIIEQGACFSYVCLWVKYLANSDSIMNNNINNNKFFYKNLDDYFLDDNTYQYLIAWMEMQEKSANNQHFVRQLDVDYKRNNQQKTGAFTKFAKALFSDKGPENVRIANGFEDLFSRNLQPYSDGITEDVANGFCSTEVVYFQNFRHPNFGSGKYLKYQKSMLASNIGNDFSEAMVFFQNPKLSNDVIHVFTIGINWIGKQKKKNGAGHAMAMAVFPSQKIAHFFDPNTGVYQIPISNIKEGVYDYLMSEYRNQYPDMVLQYLSSSHYHLDAQRPHDVIFGSGHR